MSSLNIHIYSRKIGHVLLALLCSAFVLSLAIIITISIVGIDQAVSEPGNDIPSIYVLFPYFYESLLVLLLLNFIALCTVALYNKMLLTKPKQAVTTVNSILQGDAKNHEKQIINMLKTIAKPLPGKTKLNRAATAQFIRALTELNYIDSNLKAAHILPWVEQVTGFEDGETAHFQAAYNKASKLDTNVQKHIAQLQSL